MALKIRLLSDHHKGSSINKGFESDHHEHHEGVSTVNFYV